MAHGIADSIFWVEVERIKPNPYQPRKTFDEEALRSLSESIRSYGVLQPLTVTRKEIERPGEGIVVEYELIAGERRLRASKLAGLREVPVVIRSGEDTDRMKLELAIIENLQREDLNPLDRAKAFRRLADEFGLQHKEIGQRVGKSREYVSNTLRILLLPQDMQLALERGDISEGHTRPLLMLADKPQEQMTLFKEIIERRLTVRDTEQLARRVAVERVRHKALVSPDLLNLEKQLSERLGTRVRIEKKDTGGKVMIDFFSPEDLTQLCLALTAQQAAQAAAPAETPAAMPETISEPAAAPAPQAEKESDDLYSLKDFTL
ncbi:MAG TPA: ParB/RepB/Spo0J family partition protein [Candidatus Paceibacterota bacterium]|nr:ParB/RepB/Spo0J family partition protein [Candidatus Paceibacterota bacterium]